MSNMYNSNDNDELKYCWLQVNENFIPRKGYYDNPNEPFNFNEISPVMKFIRDNFCDSPNDIYCENAEFSLNVHYENAKRKDFIKTIQSDKWKFPWSWEIADERGEKTLHPRFANVTFIIKGDMTWQLFSWSRQYLSLDIEYIQATLQGNPKYIRLRHGNIMQPEMKIPPFSRMHREYAAAKQEYNKNMSL
jgi:hypothetical protein